MAKRFDSRVRVPATALVAGLLIGAAVSPLASVQAQGAARVFELRTCTAPEGKLDALAARFHDHTMRLFDKYGMQNIGYFTPQDAPRSANTPVHLIAHPDRQTARRNRDTFRNDPEWQKVAAESEADGRILERIESVCLDATALSPLK